MHSATLQTSGSNGKQWPDFYSILDSSPEIDSETLRHSINALYVKANEQSDHRELNTRFYNQVLTQKVLPQCRRILLNEGSREAYNRQWYLHREGAATALSYQEFIREISKDAGTARALLLSDDEISLLPGFGTAQGASNAPLSDSQTPAPVKSAPVGPPDAPPPGKKSFPVVPLLAGLLVLGIGGAVWNASRSSSSSAPPAVAPSPVAAPVAAAPVAAATPTATDQPLMTLNSVAKNTDFEAGKGSWVATNLTGFVGEAYQNDAKSGGNFLTFWSKGKTDSTVSQTITGLKPGKYTFRAWTRRGGGQTQADMWVEGYGGPKRVQVMPYGWSYVNTSLADIEVTKGQCTIGFSVKSPADKTTNIDAVEFFRQP